MHLSATASDSWLQRLKLQMYRKTINHTTNTANLFCRLFGRLPRRRHVRPARFQCRVDLCMLRLCRILC